MQRVMWASHLLCMGCWPGTAAGCAGLRALPACAQYIADVAARLSRTHAVHADMHALMAMDTKGPHTSGKACLPCSWAGPGPPRAGLGATTEEGTAPEAVRGRCREGGQT